MNQEQDQRLHEMLCAYVLGEANDAERAEIERELMRSPELRAERTRVERTIGMVQSALSENESLSPDAAATVRSAASGVPAVSGSRRGWAAVPWMRIAAGLGAITLGAVIVRETTQRVSTSGEQVARVEAPRRLEGLGYAEGDSAGKLDSKDAKRANELHDSAGAPAAVKFDAGFAQTSMEKAKESSLGSNTGVDRVELTQEASELVVQEAQVPNRNKIPTPELHEIDALTQAPVGATDSGSTAIGVGKSQEPARYGARLRSPDSKPANRAVQQPGDLYLLGSNEELRKAGAPLTVGSSEPKQESGALGGAVSLDRGGAPAPSAPNYDAKKRDEPVLGKFTARLGSNPPGAGGASGPSAAGPGGPMSPGAKSQSERLAVRAGDKDNGDEALKFGFSLGYFDGDENAPSVRPLARDDEQTRYYWQLTPELQQQYLDRECRRVLDNCVRRPNERPRDMFFRFWGDNPFEVAALDALSTFSADVDTASYTLARRFLNEGNVPEKAQIRTEEFVNYFKSDVAAPAQGPFAIHTDLTPSRFSTDTTRSMLRVVVRGKDIAKVDRKRLNLTFVVDVSGSMREQNRLEMVKHAMRLLVSQLDQYDRIAIVKFSTDAQRVLPLTSVANRADIESAINPLQPEGSTNSDAGLKLGYAIALGGLDTEAINRVVFLSDGVANVGETDPAKISESVKPMREKGIYLNTIGVGMSNHNDVLLEQLADKADGVCNYIDSPDEAKRALVDDFTGAFQPIARDVKIQVEFDPAQVLRYRLLGYENRAIADADFRNDKVDAGEIGAGHQVTALYELERQGGAASEKPIATVRLRWKEPRNFGTNPEQDAATEIAQPVSAAQMTTFEGAGQGYRKAVLAAQFAEILRRSIHARGDSLDDLLNESLKLQKEIPSDKDFTEFVLLVSKAKDLILRTMPACDDLCQAIDAVRENQYRRAQLEQFKVQQDAKVLDELRKQNEDMESRLRDVIRRHLESQGR